MNTQVSYFKKALVLLMAVMMVFTMMPSMAWADGGTDASVEDEYAPIIKTQPAPELENMEYNEFGGAFLEVEAEATGGGELSYHWYRVSTPEDEELGDDYAMDSMCLAPINVLGKNQFYCVVTNTVNGKDYSVRSNVVTIFVYKSYIAKLNLYKDEEKIKEISSYLVDENGNVANKNEKNAFKAILDQSRYVFIEKAEMAFSAFIYLVMLFSLLIHVF